MRNIFDQYNQPENKLTHSLASSLYEDNSKKTSIKFDKREVVGFDQLVINQQFKTDKIGIEFKKLIKS